MVSPYIGRCNYDGAYETLQHIYGSLRVTCCYLFRNNQYTAFCCVFYQASGCPSNVYYRFRRVRISIGNCGLHASARFTFADNPQPQMIYSFHVRRLSASAIWAASDNRGYPLILKIAADPDGYIRNPHTSAHVRSGWTPLLTQAFRPASRN